MRIEHWIPKATKTHSKYATFIALPLQQWLHERVSRSRYTYIACIVKVKDKGLPRIDHEGAEVE